jgi:hypothetical protein
MTSETIHLLFTAAGALLGWYLKHRQTAVSPQAREVLALLEERLAQKRRQDAQGLLADLSQRTAKATAEPPH